ncbi:tRNA threonylcarbamoyladenosine dehydratase [Carboxylicivirga caseinilyticus]|uniref:tRNA threonylcarbamoyladenosine dehydratase n=1 Tax=Carboxylicivirga caseinilyticus TaxID=3417572 RepID=UPI003D33B9A5|nr:tRNA threonylcarbamoyladenosine dehydratase [Marinilabiliaceae bacterium A049]
MSIFHRAELILGKDSMHNLASKKVILFGIGGVGSWCAESLIRTGIMDLTIVDSDRVTASNINRQLMATSKTVGEVKTEALRNRLLDINPEAQITSLQKIYSKETSSDFNLNEYDVIIDAIDSLGSKVHLIRAATQTDALFVSSMGAALKVDPTRVRVDEFWNVQGCPLARKIRKLVRKVGVPQRPFLCVYSDEVMENIGAEEITEPISKEETTDTTGPGDPDLVNHDWSDHKAVINGSLAHITAIFGFTLAGLIIKELTQ